MGAIGGYVGGELLVCGGAEFGDIDCVNEEVGNTQW